jgi:hypothetical protein
MSGAQQSALLVHAEPHLLLMHAWLPQSRHEVHEVGGGELASPVVPPSDVVPPSGLVPPSPGGGVGAEDPHSSAVWNAARS